MADGAAAEPDPVDASQDASRAPVWRGRTRLALGVVLVAALGLRLAYLAAQPGSDPFLAVPFVDGEVYVEWARALAAGEEPAAAPADQAFYHAPLYPTVLAWILRMGGDSLRVVFVVQSLLSLATAGLLAWIGARRFGPVAGVASAALYAFYQPVVFFAATPMGETLGLFLLVAGLAARECPALASRGLAGLLLGASALVRPNFLLVGLALGVVDLVRREWRSAGAFALGAALALVPVAVRNTTASGHFVPISSNGGVTLYHGNAPGARGTYLPIPGTSGDPARQRDETTALARRETGRDLDAIEADAWWGAKARAARMDDPAATLGLLCWRALLALDTTEHALDYDPLLDENPWRPVLRVGGDDLPGSARQVFLVPFAFVFGLEVLGLFARDPSGRKSTAEGRASAVWLPVLATFVTPVLFYVSSRYRLPFAVLLALPAGVGVASLLRCGWSTRGRPWALAVAGIAVLVSFAVPSGDLAESGRRQSLSNRLGVLTKAGRYDEAEESGRAALLLGESYELRFNLGYLYTRMRRGDLAIDEYARAFELNRGRVEAARELGLALVRARRFTEAIEPLEAAVAADAREREVWAALLTALDATGDRAGVEDARRQARAAGHSF